MSQGERPSPFEIVGTLPDWALKAHIREGLIKIDPLPVDWEKLVDEVTIDLHLGKLLRFFRSDGLDTIDTCFTTKDEMAEMMHTVELKAGQPFVLTADKFVIATTRERLTLPDDILGRLDGKSSLARLGVLVHSTAARFDPGWDGPPVLEFSTVLKGKEILLYEGMPICAFSFERLAWSVERSYRDNPNKKYGGELPDVSNMAHEVNLGRLRDGG